ncbi:NTP transferase domain-containing protein [Patescibacteria group bacterium]|nr:NTP transferase domain-containing protein [Patescibacteria group bacterium]MBU4367433.1 NTP transferase domain-containing protein [Patescibacteria group bacterium]MBU4461753.1 NTP transferase domain-containing protein [Patescibacteria group bacterium]MCG2700137.1 NTP transferase domain-containing protein [Candidatus Parcubacteria bacterium]
MIKTVIVAAAGQGARMLHLTKNKSKHLIKVNRKPFLAYVLDNLLQAGYKEIILVVGHASDLMKQFLKEYGYKATVVNQFDILGPKEKIYGTACPLMCTKDILKGKQFLFVCGDNLYSVRDLKEMTKDDNYNYVAGLVHENPEKYGILITDNGFLKEIIEKPKKYVGNLINTGMYKFTPEVFDKLPKIKKSPRGEYEITDVITLLAKDKKVKVVKIDDRWLDFGNPGDIIKCSKFLKGENNYCQKRKS